MKHLDLEVSPIFGMEKVIIGKSTPRDAIITLQKVNTTGENMCKNKSVSYAKERLFISKKMRKLTDTHLKDSDENIDNMDVSLQIKDMLGSWGQSSQPELNNKNTTPRTPNTEYKNEAQNALTKILLESS